MEKINTIKEPLILYEIVKLAKEKGFSNKVNNAEGIYYAEDILEDNKAYYLWICLVQKWLREEHKIDCRVASNSLTYHFPMNAILEEDGSQMCGPKILIRYNTHEEALEAGLQEALKLI